MDNKKMTLSAATDKVSNKVKQSNAVILSKMGRDYNFDAIPECLKAYNHWLGFVLVSKGEGKFKKVPCNARFATESNKSGTVSEKIREAWMNFADAFKQYQAGLCDGLGFVLVDTPFLVIDKDNSIVWTDGNFELNIGLTIALEKTQCWAEFSVGAKGGHIFVEASKPFVKTSFEWGELLGDNPEQGFVAITGFTLPNAGKDILNCQEFINDLFAPFKPEDSVPKVGKFGAPIGFNQPVDLSDEELKRKMFNNSHTGSIIWNLFNNEPKSTDDWSNLDMRLMGYLAFWFGKDAVRMERVFKTSKLYRVPGQKYFGKSKTDKYLQGTIQAAIKNCHDTYTQKGVVVHSELEENSIPDAITPSIATVAAIVESESNFDDSGMPLLPESAMLDYSLGADVCPWLGDYVEFSKKWSPRGYDLFHVACGLWVLSAISAGRLQSSIAKTTILNLFLVGESGWQKTTTGNIAFEIAESAVQELVFQGDYTPQALLQFMAEDKPFVAQRSLHFDEFGGFLTKINNEASAWNEYSRFIRNIYDGTKTYNTATVGRGLQTVNNPFMCILGTVTTDELTNKKNGDLWSNGMFARANFAYVPKSYQRSKATPPNGIKSIRDELTQPLKAWHNRLGIPNEITEAFEKTTVYCSDEAFTARYNYYEALTDLSQASVNKDLKSNYQRFHDTAARIAMLFASFDGSETIELKHWAKGQGIAELFRQSLHWMYKDNSSETIGKIGLVEQKVIEILRKHPNFSANEIRNANKSLTSADVVKAIADLLATDVIEISSEGKAKKYRLTA